MSTIKKEVQKLNNGEWDEALTGLYGEDVLDASKARYTKAFERFAKTYGWDRKVRIFSVPEQLFIGKNDQVTISAATTKDILAIVADNGTNIFRFQSVGFFGEENIDLYQPGPYAEEVGTMSALLRGMLTAFRNNEYDVYGVDIYVDTELLPEENSFFYETVLVTLATIFNSIFNEEKISSTDFLKAIQWVASNYFHKNLLTIGTYPSFEGGVIAGYKISDEEYAYKHIPAEAVANTYCVFEVKNASGELSKENEETKKELFDLLFQNHFDIPHNLTLQNTEEVATVPLVEKAVGGASIWRMKQSSFSSTAHVFAKKEEANDIETKLMEQYGKENVSKVKIRNQKAKELTKVTEKKTQEIPYDYFEGE